MLAVNRGRSIQGCGGVSHRAYRPRGDAHEALDSALESLRRWLSFELIRSAREPPAPALQLFEAVVEAPPSGEAGPGLVIELPGGGRALVSAAGQVPWTAQLLRLLTPTGGRPC